MAHLRLSLLILIAVMSGDMILASSSPANASALEDARAAFAKQDFALSVTKFQEAADQGDPEALALLGTMYEEGIGVPYDHEKAFSLNMKAAEKGRVDAQFHLSMAYWRRTAKDPDRESRERDSAERFKWLKMATIGAASKAENGDPIAQWVFGETCGDSSKTILWVTKAAEQKVVSAQFRLGQIYETSDPPKAREWYAKAALAGHAGAAVRLAAMLEESDEKPHWRSSEEAKLLYTRAALAGDETASAMLRDHYNIHVGDTKEFDQIQADLLAKEPVSEMNRLIDAGVRLGTAIKDLNLGGEAPSPNSEYEHVRQRIEQQHRLFCDSPSAETRHSVGCF